MKAFVLFPVMFLIIALFPMTACHSGNQSTPHAQGGRKEVSVPDSIVQFLINSAAADFYFHQAVSPSGFRNVEVGYLLSGDNKIQYLLCGEYRSENKGWQSFATIQTSDYEQYLGGGDKPISYCEDAIRVSTNKSKLSAELKNKLDQLMAKENP